MMEGAGSVLPTPNPGGQKLMDPEHCFQQYVSNFKTKQDENPELF